MMEEEGMISSTTTNRGCEEDHLIDDANWFKDDFTAWLARYEQLEQGQKKIGKQYEEDDGLMNVVLEQNSNTTEEEEEEENVTEVVKCEPCNEYQGVGLNHESLQNMTLSDAFPRGQEALMVNPQSLLKASHQQDLAQPGTLNCITTVQKNAAGTNIPWLKATVSKKVSMHMAIYHHLIMRLVG